MPDTLPRCRICYGLGRGEADHDTEQHQLAEAEKRGECPNCGERVPAPVLMCAFGKHTLRQVAG